MDGRFWGALSAALLAQLLVFSQAHADIYTWVDADGRVNLSNLDPPDGVKVTNVVHVNPPPVNAASDAARDALRDQEMQALADRVHQLQDQVDMARRTSPPDYRPVALPPPPSYSGDWAPPPLPYTYAAPQNDNSGCDVSWASCPLGWNNGFYPGYYVPSVVVVQSPYYRRFPHGHNGGYRPMPHNNGPVMPLRMASGGRAR